MELIKISNQKLKIMLTPSDMTQYELKSDEITSGEVEVLKNFRKLLDDVCQKANIAFDDRHLSVQYFPSKEGGGEMFITGFSLICAAEEKKKTAHASEASRRQCRTPTVFRKECAYRFFSIDSLIRACCRLRSLPYISESQAYRDDPDKTDCYLLLAVQSSAPFSLPEELAFLTEYGQIENAATLRIYFREHGSLICETHAIEILGALG